MRSQRGDIELAASISILLLFGIGYLVFGNWSCKSRWDGSNVPDVSWGPVQGCKVKLPDGRWIPDDRVREIGIQKGATNDYPR